jgi:hypothetical protein
MDAGGAATVPAGDAGAVVVAGGGIDPTGAGDVGAIVAADGGIDPTGAGATTVGGGTGAGATAAAGGCTAGVVALGGGLTTTVGGAVVAGGGGGGESCAARPGTTWLGPGVTGVRAGAGAVEASPACPFALSGNCTRLITPPSVSNTYSRCTSLILTPGATSVSTLIAWAGLPSALRMAMLSWGLPEKITPFNW